MRYFLARLKRLDTIAHMTNKPGTHNASWWNHETDPSKLAQVSTAFAELQREQHEAGWRRNGLVVACIFSLGAAIKLFAFS